MLVGTNMVAKSLDFPREILVSRGLPPGVSQFGTGKNEGFCESAYLVVDSHRADCFCGSTADGHQI
jgi:hypothetical protein